MVVRILDLVPACNTSAQGAVVADAVRAHLQGGHKVRLSFAGVSDVPSSFVNASIVKLFNEMQDGELPKNLAIGDVNSQIAEMIRRCLDNNARNRSAA